MAEQKIVEDILQSMHIIASSLDSKVNKDVTTLCEIVNVDRASEGIYLVKEQEAEYEAYSESKFEIGDQVYVTIPKGDYNEQKLIMGKKVAENTTPFNWISPFDSFFKIVDWDTSHASYVGDDDPNDGLLANGTIEERLLIPWTTANVTGFDRLGLKAGFKNNLTSCVSGNYGLRLELQVTNYFDTNAKTTSIIPYTLEVADMWGNPYNFPSYFTQEKVFELDGDKDTTIEKWRLFFFQEQHSFKDEDGNEYPITIDTGIGRPKPMPNNLFVDNIEISLGYKTEETYGDKVYLFCANGTNYGSGNSTASIKAMVAEIMKMQLYCADPDTTMAGRDYYTALIHAYVEKILSIMGPDEYATYLNKPESEKDTYLNSLHLDGINEKQLKARWWHLDEDGNGMVIDENDEFIVGASVNLYRYNSKAIADELGGPGYELLESHGPHEADGDTPLDFTFIPDPNKAEEHLKIVIYKYSSDLRVKYERNDQGEEIAVPVTDSQGNELYELEYAYSSEVLILTNDNGVKDETMTALRIKPEDDYRGIYNIYDATTWELTDITEGKIPRKLHLYFNSENLSLKYLDRADSIIWTVPKTETMVVFDNMPAADLVVDTADGLFTEYHYLTPYAHTANNTNEDYDTAQLNISYCIDFSYIAGYTNNIVSCRVLRDGITYNAQFEFKFGMRGNVSDGNVILFTLGDDYNNITTDGSGKVTAGTLVEPRVQAWTRSSSQFISIIRRFYNKNGEELNAQWTALTHYAGDELFKQVNAEIRDVPMVGIVRKDNNNINSNETYGEIMTCTATVDGIDYDVYLTIPIRSTRKFISVNGPKQIYFDHNGYNPKGTDKYFSCWYIDDQHGFHSAVGRGDVKRPNGAGADVDLFSDCLPALYSDSNGSGEKRYYLKAPGQFFTDLAPYTYSVQLNYIDDQGIHNWVQPILITLNPYDNSILNEWDGKLKIDEENNYILASMMGAGWKDKENHFTGAIMGVVDDITQNTTQKLPSNTGLFGFESGVGAFAFKADGTAYIGKAGTARINFDGNAGTIENAGYGNASSGGMHIDLTGNIENVGQRPWINMHAANGAAVYIGTGGGTTPTTSNPDPIPRTNMYFRIKAPKRTGDTDGPILMQIGNRDQFIQTADYVENGTTGLKIDLTNGTFDSKGSLTIKGGTMGQDASVYFSTNDATATVAGQTNKTDWRLTVGSNFGVDKNGNVYANAGKIGDAILSDGALLVEQLYIKNDDNSYTGYKPKKTNVLTNVSLSTSSNTKKIYYWAVQDDSYTDTRTTGIAGYITYPTSVYVSSSARSGTIERQIWDEFYSAGVANPTGTWRRGGVLYDGGEGMAAWYYSGPVAYTAFSAYQDNFQITYIKSVNLSKTYLSNVYVLNADAEVSTGSAGGITLNW